MIEKLGPPVIWSVNLSVSPSSNRTVNDLNMGPMTKDNPKHVSLKIKLIYRQWFRDTEA